MSMSEALNKQSVIAIRHLTFGYQRATSVLEDIDFTVPQGQSLAILGVNGAGKSTLLQLIVGLLRPWSGHCVINELLVPSISKVFLMTESENLIPKLTLRENIYLHQLILGDEHQIHASDINGATLSGVPVINAFNLGPHLDTAVAALSSGFRQRAGIAAGMLFNPDVILLDEPTNAVDPETRELLVDFTRQLQQTGHTVVCVTHDLDYCWRTSERFLILDDKRMVADLMKSEFDDFKSFQEATSFGREQREVDFGLHRV